MLVLRNLIGLLLLVLPFLIIKATLAQTYPNKPIHIICPEPGGGADLAARLIAQGITGPLGQSVIVDNRPSGIILGQTVAKSQADGYTLLLTGNTHWLLPLLQNNVPFDPVNDFAPISVVASAPLLLVVHPSVSANTVRELIELAKAKPGELNYAAGATGSSNHLAGELFKSMAGVNIASIPYKGGGPALNDVVAGRVQLMFFVAPAVTPHVKTGRLKALAVTSAQSSALAPGLPTISGSGLPGYEMATTYAMFAPARTPAAALKLLNQEITRVLNTAEVKERLLSAGVESAGTSPEQLAATVKADMARMGKVIKEAGIKLE